MNNQIRGLSLSYNKHFNDECLRQLVEVLPDLQYLRTLELSKLNLTEHAMTKLSEILPIHLQNLKELDLSNNQQNFFAFDSLTLALKSGKLNL